MTSSGDAADLRVTRTAQCDRASFHQYSTPLSVWMVSTTKGSWEGT